MAQGDWHELNGYYRFQETFHGPNVEHSCVDCGLLCYGTPSWPTPRCEKCLKHIHGLNVGGRSEQARKGHGPIDGAP